MFFFVVNIFLRARARTARKIPPVQGGLRHYHHVFWTLDASARRIGSFSPPFVLPSLPGQILEPKRLVQFPMSATYIGERVVVAYGTDDCFSAAVTFDLALIMALLRVPRTVTWPRDSAGFHP